MALSFCHNRRAMSNLASPILPGQIPTICVYFLNQKTAPLSFAPLRFAPLRFASLRSAPLRSAPLRFAPLRFVLLRFASLRFAPLRFASLRSALLRYAPLRFASLRSALPRIAPLRFASLRFAPGEISNSPIAAFVKRFLTSLVFSPFYSPRHFCQSKSQQSVTSSNCLPREVHQSLLIIPFSLNDVLIVEVYFLNQKNA